MVGPRSYSSADTRCSWPFKRTLGSRLAVGLRHCLKGWAATIAAEPDDGATPEQRLDFAGDPTLVTGEELLFVLDEWTAP
jgi:hypothetical protein